MSAAIETNQTKGFLSAGAGLVWRRQRILRWIFVVNLGCAFLGTLPAALHLNQVLHHTLAGTGLAKGFDVGMLNELSRPPNVSLRHYTTSSLVFVPLFALFMLFITGGILETYRRDRRISTAEFFEASGSFFWPFVRLMLFSLVPFAFLGGLYGQLRSLSDYIADKAAADQVGLYALVPGVILLALLALFVRLWFDIAKIRAVAQEERTMWRCMWKALSITRGKIGRLMWIYFCISLFAWIILLAVFLIWTKLPPTATVVTFLLLQAIIVAQLAARLWQLASATAWYRRQMEIAPDDLADYTTLQPEEVVNPVASAPESEVASFAEPEAPPSA